MGKSSHFIGQPSYGQLTKSLVKEKILGISLKYDGERYVKHFDAYTHLLTMLYAVIMRFDSLREIETAMTAEVNKLHHIGIGAVPRRSTLSDANTGARKRYSRWFIVIYMSKTAVSFHRTAAQSTRNNG